MSTASNHSIYAKWRANTYTVTLNADIEYYDGEPVYFDPVIGESCTSSDYTASQSATGVKTGCMKWYAFLDNVESSTVNLLLDHNTTEEIGAEVGSGIDGSIDVLYSILESDTSDWNNNINNIRLISAEEVSEITGVSIPYGGKEYNSLPSEYSWISNPDGSDGYITSTYSDYESMMVNVVTDANYHTSYAMFSYYTDNHFGIRPVIEIDKSLLGMISTTKTVTYDSTYGTLPTLTRDGYTFQGWYTTGGVKIESTTKVTKISNHTLYAQWTANTYTVTLNASGGIIIDETKNYQNGEIVYFNPVRGASCTSSDYTASQSATGIKTGCMKWYAFLDNVESSTVNLLLDHNTTERIGLDIGIRLNNIDTLYSLLENDTANWSSNISNIRVISAEETSEITGVAVPYDGKEENPLPAQYSWIYNPDGSNGYITSTSSNDTNMMVNVNTIENSHGYAMFSYYTERFGIRPVIEVDRSLLGASISTKTVTYGSIYGTLPTPSSGRATFKGWYTAETGGIQITSSSVVNTANNHTLYAQWNIPTLYDVILADNTIAGVRSSFDAVFANNTTGSVYRSTKTNDGSTSYYYAGNTTNNWVKFGTYSNDYYFGYADTDLDTYVSYNSLEECNSAASYNVGCTKAISKGDPMYWRIMRTDKGKTVKLLYAGNSPYGQNGNITSIQFNITNTHNTYVGYKYGTGSSLTTDRYNTYSSTIKTYLDNWYSKELLNNYDNYISKDTVYCVDRATNSYVSGNTTYYAARDRLYTNKTPTYQCNGYPSTSTTYRGTYSTASTNDQLSASSSVTNNKLDYPIGLATADEIAFAGAVYDVMLTDSQYPWYFTNANNESIVGGRGWWTISPSYFNYTFAGNLVVFGNSSTAKGKIGVNNVNTLRGLRPVIGLKSCVKVSFGTGTATSPYELIMDETCS